MLSVQGMCSFLLDCYEKKSYLAHYLMFQISEVQFSFVIKALNKLFMLKLL